MYLCAVARLRFNTSLNAPYFLLPLVLNTRYTLVPPKNLSRGISEPQKTHRPFLYSISVFFTYTMNV